MKYILLDKNTDEKETEINRDEALKLLQNNFKNASAFLEELEKGRLKDGITLTFTKLFVRE